MTLLELTLFKQLWATCLSLIQCLQYMLEIIYGCMSPLLKTHKPFSAKKLAVIETKVRTASQASVTHIFIPICMLHSFFYTIPHFSSHQRKASGLCNCYICRHGISWTKQHCQQACSLEVTETLLSVPGSHFGTWGTLPAAWHTHCRNPCVGKAPAEQQHCGQSTGCKNLHEHYCALASPYECALAE